MSAESSVVGSAMREENCYICHGGDSTWGAEITSRAEGVTWKDHKDRGESLGLHWASRASRAFYGFRGTEAWDLSCEEGGFPQTVQQAMSAPVFRAVFLDYLH